MKILIGLVLVLVLLAVVAIALKNKNSTGGVAKKGRFVARPIATEREQSMFWKLTEAFPPPYIVLTQVSFGALLRAKDGASRSSFSQKMADFVVLNKGFQVLAMVELDDASHKGKQDKDADRDAMLIEAGYKVRRYAQIPDVTTLRGDIGVSEDLTLPLSIASKRK